MHVLEEMETAVDKRPIIFPSLVVPCPFKDLLWMTYSINFLSENSKQEILTTRNSLLY